MTLRLPRLSPRNLSGFEIATAVASQPFRLLTSVKRYNYLEIVIMSRTVGVLLSLKGAKNDYT